MPFPQAPWRGLTRVLPDDKRIAQDHGDLRPALEPMECQPLLAQDMRQVSPREAQLGGDQPGGVGIGESIPGERHPPTARDAVADDCGLVDTQTWGEVGTAPG